MVEARKTRKRRNMTPSYKTLKKRCNDQSNYFHKLHEEYTNAKAKYERRLRWGFPTRLAFLFLGNKIDRV